MQFMLHTCIVRSWREEDAQSLAYHANNRAIWRNLRDAFPHPYALDDARRFIRFARVRVPETYFCIAVDEVAVGSIGFSLNSDIERFSAEIGYWLGEPYWGRGIVTEALRAVTGYAMQEHGLFRVYALPFAHNLGSCRVLEKAGYRLEGRLRRSAFKDAEVLDQCLYAYTDV